MAVYDTVYEVPNPRHQTYEAATLMQCTMLRKVDYIVKADLIARQQEAVVAKIRQISKSHIVYPGLSQFQNAEGDVVVDPNDVPGLSEYFCVFFLCLCRPHRLITEETGWNHALANTGARSADYQFMWRTLLELQNLPHARAFRVPVSQDDVPDYYDFIKHPMGE